MTTIIGIKTNSGVEGIVLGADTQLNFFVDGDRLQSKKPICKMVYGKNWIMSDGGTTSEEIHRFYQILSGQKRAGSSQDKANDMIIKAVANYEMYKENSRNELLHFPEINTLNATHIRNGIELDNLSSFILAINTENNGPRLFEIDPFGNLKEAKGGELQYVLLGSGSDRAENCIKRIIDEEDTSPILITIPKAIRIVRKALNDAQKDPSTGGPVDIAILTPSGVDYQGKRLKEVLTDAENKFFQELEEKYITQP